MSDHMPQDYIEEQLEQALRIQAEMPYTPRPSLSALEDREDWSPGLPSTSAKSEQTADVQFATQSKSGWQGCWSPASSQSTLVAADEDTSKDSSAKITTSPAGKSKAKQKASTLPSISVQNGGDISKETRAATIQDRGQAHDDEKDTDQTSSLPSPRSPPPPSLPPSPTTDPRNLMRLAQTSSVARASLATPVHTPTSTSFPPVPLVPKTKAKMKSESHPENHRQCHRIVKPRHRRSSPRRTDLDCFSYCDAAMKVERRILAEKDVRKACRWMLRREFLSPRMRELVWRQLEALALGGDDDGGVYWHESGFGGQDEVEEALSPRCQTGGAPFEDALAVDRSSSNSGDEEDESKLPCQKNPLLQEKRSRDLISSEHHICHERTANEVRAEQGIDTAVVEDYLLPLIDEIEVKENSGVRNEVENGWDRRNEIISKEEAVKEPTAFINKLRALQIDPLIEAMRNCASVQNLNILGAAHGPEFRSVEVAPFSTNPDDYPSPATDPTLDEAAESNLPPEGQECGAIIFEESTSSSLPEVVEETVTVDAPDVGNGTVATAELPGSTVNSRSKERRVPFVVDPLSGTVITQRAWAASHDAREIMLPEKTQACAAASSSDVPSTAIMTAADPGFEENERQPRYRGKGKEPEYEGFKAPKKDSLGMPVLYEPKDYLALPASRPTSPELNK